MWPASGGDGSGQVPVVGREFADAWWQCIRAGTSGWGRGFACCGRAGSATPIVGSVGGGSTIGGRASVAARLEVGPRRRRGWRRAWLRRGWLQGPAEARLEAGSGEGSDGDMIHGG